MIWVKCDTCGTNFQPDHGCGIAVICGKSFVEHCLEKDEDIAKKLEHKSFKPWEAPAGNCPLCWHAEQRKINPPKTLCHAIKGS